MNKPTFKLSALSKAILPVLSLALVAGCNNSNDDGTITPPDNSSPQVSVPGFDSMPTNPEIAANELLVSYVKTDGTSSRALTARAATDWTLVCGDSEYTAASEDSFGPYWVIDNTSSLGNCDIVQDGATVLSVTLDPSIQMQGVTEDGTVVKGNRQQTLLTSIGLDQEGTDVKMPEVEAPGDDLANTPSGYFAIQIYDPMGDYKDPEAGLNGYGNMNLHLWNNNPSCNAGDSDGFNNGWDDVSVTPDDADDFGPVWYVPVTDDPTECFNAIIRNGNKDKIIDNDLTIDISNIHNNPTVTYVPGNATPFDSRTAAFEEAGPSDSFAVDSVGAILLDEKTMVWRAAEGADIVQIMFSEDGQYHVSDAGVVSALSIKLTSTSLTDEQKEKFPHLSDYPAFEIPANLSNLVKSSLVAVASQESDSTATLRSSTAVQYAGALDAIFAEEATTLEYGTIYDGGDVNFRLWAPTALSVELVIYDSAKNELEREEMTEDIKSGAWSISMDADDVDGKFYRYAIKVFQPKGQVFTEYEVTDPYSVSLSMNSEYSQVIDLDSDDLKPSGWDGLSAPHPQDESNGDLANMVIYESHVRDFSALDQSTVNRGKYLAFTEQNSIPVNHLKELSEAGMTHLHLMPVFDIATINEDPDQVANIDEPFSKLCSVNPSIQSNDKFNSYCTSAYTLAEVFEMHLGSDTPDNPVIQELNEYVRGVDSYNWGYDPFHYTVPEGSYATDAEGTQRILEFREMVMSIKEDIGMNVVIDVVYNHTNASGYTSDKSVLDKIVPLYYHRLVPDTGLVETSTCCDNTAPEHAMFAKLIDDSIQTWVKDYKIDAFRWDLMGHHPLDQMIGTLEAAREVNPEVYFYGEGWNFGEVENDKRFVQATQPNLAGTGIGSFSDRLRDAVRGGSPFESGDDIRKAQGFGTGAATLPNELVLDGDDEVSDAEMARALHQSDLIRLGMAGNLKSFKMIDFEGNTKLGEDVDYNGQQAGYAAQPWEIQNYASKHDNQTLWDINMYKVDESASTEDRVKMQTISMATVLLGQAMPFNHMGAELLRSKSMQRDSYDFGDWYNFVDFTRNDNNWNVGLPAAEKDYDNYAQIDRAFHDMYAMPSAHNIDQMYENYLELLKLRSSTALITLPNADEINSRVDFRNTGVMQKAGLIVMTVDNGASQSTDLDSTLDSLVVILNARPDAQTVSGFVDNNGDAIELAGFELSDIHSTTGMAAGATFSSGAFTVPEWSVSVFVQPRSGDRGLGLPVSEKSDDLPPFGARAVYIAGDFAQATWDPAGIEVPYANNGLYSVTLGLAKDTGYKFTLGNWDDQFACQGDNCPSNFTEVGMYKFTLNASDASSPVVVDAELVESYVGKDWYIPGQVSEEEWSHTNASLMTAESDSTLVSFTTKPLEAGTTYGFKFTCGDWGKCEHSSAHVTPAEGSLPFAGSGNIEFTPSANGTYEISFDYISKEVLITAN